MTSLGTFEKCKRRYIAMLDAAGIILTPQERDEMEIADFGLGDIERAGLGLVVYENNDRYCAKEIIMLPGQTCPQHRHPPIRNEQGQTIDPGKRETFRCRQGEVLLYVNGPAAADPLAQPPAGDEAYYTVWNEVHLKPGQQYTIEPGVWHWFQAGEDGAIISEFSTTSRDEADEFTDPRIQRVPDAE